MFIREATPADGAALLNAMQDAPQGRDLIVTLTNAPDFFNRARIYDHSRVFMAEENGQPAGSAAYAIRTVHIDGRPTRVGYEFQYFVSTGFQRRGVASRLRSRIEQELIDDGTELTSAIIICSNQPSIRLFEQSGFRCERLLSVTMLQTAVHNDIHAHHAVRPARWEDIPAIVQLMNETWANSDHYSPQTPYNLMATIARVPGCSLDSLYVLEEAGEVVASAGIWRWRDVQQINTVAIDTHLRQRLPGLRAGESWRQWGLSPVAFRKPEDLTRLLGPICNLAHAAGIEQVGVVVDRAHAISDAVEPLPHFEVAVGLFVKPLTREFANTDRPVFVDVTDI